MTLVDAAEWESAILHGDAHPGNLLPTVDGLLWTDFEDVSRGPLDWDLATLGAVPVVRELAPGRFPIDADRLAGFGRLRALQVGLCLAGLRDVMAEVPGWDDGIRWALDVVDPGASA